MSVICDTNCTYCCCVELFDMKTRYEESDNIVVRATRTVTDKMSELFGTMFNFVIHHYIALHIIVFL